MKVVKVEVVRLRFPYRKSQSRPWRESWGERWEVASPMALYPPYKPRRSLWGPRFDIVGVKITAENGVWGLGWTGGGRPVATLIEDHLARFVVGQEVFATEKVWDILVRATTPIGSSGLSAFAISALDLALWDVKGKVLGLPVFRLIGGPQKEKIFCYATGNDTDWHLELGFQATKLACPYGPVDGMRGLEENEKLVAQTRELVGDSREVMLDCWMALDVDYAVTLAERLRPYRLRWMEECLLPDDWDSHRALRERIPWQTLATGEHWYLLYPFDFACRYRVVDILQPDIQWCGGLTACLKIADLARGAGLTVILHGGGNTPYGQHFTFARPESPWCEFFIGSAPGIPLEEINPFPEMALPKDGWLVPNDAPGFGVEIKEEWMEPFH
ncbi:MAG: L-rhamnonate dehydratase [Armatimonadetes bacterium]|nr:L-rhamnonate dehydratase [Armatimonadota bacterium]MDW8121866.1 enolase C-terminal domain-like protein [Armatimonadota bacterium]